MNKLFLILIFSAPLFAQTIEKEKWGAVVPDYTIKFENGKSYAVEKTSAASGFLSYLRNGYYFLISEYDGDNCGFYPSCSQFFVSAVKRINIAEGSLLFGSRFMRDMNVFKVFQGYHIHENGKLYDPPKYYSIKYSELKPGQTSLE